MIRFDFPEAEVESELVKWYLLLDALKKRRKRLILSHFFSY